MFFKVLGLIHTSTNTQSKSIFHTISVVYFK